jgi:hypothetical protein
MSLRNFLKRTIGAHDEALQEMKQINPSLYQLTCQELRPSTPENSNAASQAADIVKFYNLLRENSGNLYNVFHNSFLTNAIASRSTMQHTVPI